MNLERELNAARRDIRIGIALIFLAPLVETALIVSILVWL